MGIKTRTFPFSIKPTTTTAITEVFHLRNLTINPEDELGIYLEAIYCNGSLASFPLFKTPEYDGDETEAEKFSKFTAAENASQKIGLRILIRKTGETTWREKAEIIIVNRGRKDYFDLLNPYMTKQALRLLEQNDEIAIQLVDYGYGLLKQNDFLEIEFAIRIESEKKNNEIEQLKLDLETLKLAIDGRLTNLSAGTVLGRDTTTGTVQQLPQSRFATPAQIDQAIIDLVGGAPGALNTLIEVAAALNNDANFGSTMINVLAAKAPLANSLQLTNRSNTVAAPFDANNWTNTFFAAVKWLDGGYTNLNVPINTGMVIQFDSLFLTGVKDKYRVQIYFASNRYFVRIENNGTWGTWREITTVAI